MTTWGDSAAQPRTMALPTLVALVALGLSAIVSAPADAARPAARGAKVRLTEELPLTPLQTKIGIPGQFVFTAPGAPALPTSLANGFQFTPSGRADSRGALSLGLATRVTAPTVDKTKANAPFNTLIAADSFGLNLSVGWQGFALNTGYSHVEPVLASPLAGRMTDAINLGLSYGGRNWRTRLEGTAEQSQPLAFAPLTRRYSLELGGAYRFAPRLSVTGGVRYRLAPEVPSLVLPDRDDQAVYFGTNIAF